MASCGTLVLVASAQSRFRLTAVETRLPAPIAAPMSVDVAADGEHGEGGRPRDEDESAGRRA
jgi:hypothetical protein